MYILIWILFCVHVFCFLIHVHFDKDFVLCVHMYKKVFQDSLSREISILLFQK